MKALVYGYGVMGKKVCAALDADDTLGLTAVISPYFDTKPAVPAFESLEDYEGDADVIIDFSHPANLGDIVSYAKKTNTPVVFATTGYSEDDLKTIETLSEEVPVFQSYNTSYGVAMLVKMVRDYAKDLFEHGFDIEITEAHHRRKIDAPSGTADLLYRTMADTIDDTEPVYGRHDRHEKRGEREIGISSLRGGTIYGEHTVMFAGEDEIIKVSHEALSRDIFAHGAVAAAKTLVTKEKGLYNLTTLY